MTYFDASNLPNSSLITVSLGQIRDLEKQLSQERKRGEELEKVLHSTKDCLETLRFDIEEENPLDWFTLVHIRQELSKIKGVLE